MSNNTTEKDAMLFEVDQKEEIRYDLPGRKYILPH
jgi:hypothetical protein